MSKKQNLIDNNIYHEMWNVAHSTFVSHRMTRRGISDYFNNYTLAVPLFFRLAFRCSKIGIHLVSFESKNAAVASLTLMEKPAGSAYFSNLAFFIRPNADLKAPILHGDAMDPMVGVQGMFEMDLYNPNQSNVSIDDFLGDSITKIKESLDIVKPYQITPEQGRGKYAPYLEPYQSKYRIELAQPDAKNVEVLKKFCQDELAAFKLYTEAYLTSLSRLTPEKSIVENNKSGFDAFIGEILEKGFVARTGRKIFKDDFEKYFHEGCWRTGYYGETT